MYTILPLRGDVQNQIRELQPSHRKKIKEGEVFESIEESPKWAPGNKIGRFKGNLKHLGWHYRLTRGQSGVRIHYQIDEEKREIQITYIGPHPNYE